MYYVVVPVLVLFARSRIILLLHNVVQACSGHVRASLSYVGISSESACFSCRRGPVRGRCEPRG